MLKTFFFFCSLPIGYIYIFKLQINSKINRGPDFSGNSIKSLFFSVLQFAHRVLVKISDPG